MATGQAACVNYIIVCDVGNVIIIMCLIISRDNTVNDTVGAVLVVVSLNGYYVPLCKPTVH